MAALKPLIAGNWKMHGRAADLDEITTLRGALGGAANAVEVVICPPAVYLSAAAVRCGQGVMLGAQDCSPAAADAARTGEVSAAMLAEAGASYVIVGHSERRSLHGEDDALVRAKAAAARAAGLAPIVCVGETRAQREAGQVGEVVTAQVVGSVPDAGVVVAYEPVWAIGGDRTPSLEEIAEVHALIRTALGRMFSADAAGVRILYGGSVGPKNAADIFATPGVDGALVGRASLKAADFSAIVLAHPNATAGMR